MRRLRCLILSWAARAQTERFWTVSSKPSLLQVTPPAIARRATFFAAGAGTATAGPWSRSSAGLSPSVLFVALHAPAIILAHGVQHRLPGVRPAPQHRPSILADKENSHAKLKRTQATVGYGVPGTRERGGDTRQMRGRAGDRSAAGNDGGKRWACYGRFRSAGHDTAARRGGRDARGGASQTSV